MAKILEIKLLSLTRVIKTILIIFVSKLRAHALYNFRLTFI